MANAVNQNPIIINALLPLGWKNATVTSLGQYFPLRVQRVEWFSPNAVGDQALIIDPATGAEKVRFKCETAGVSQLIPFNELWSDFAVVQLDSGVLKIYLD